MDFSSAFPIDLVLFGMIAAFLVLRLRSILGRRTGYERPPQPYQQPAAGPGPVIDGRAEPAPAKSSTRPVPDPTSTIGQAITRIRAVDHGFDPARFLDGAEQAFRIVVAAFARGDRAALRPLVGEEVYRSFDLAITAREQTGHVQVSEIRGITSATIDDAELRGTVAKLMVRFVSDQISLTRDASGHVLTGTDAVTEIVDLWSFERDLTARDPTWRLVAVRAG